MGILIQLCTEASRKDEPFTKGSWPAAGMGYVFVTDGGRLLVIDGGETEGDAEALVSLLERKFGGHPVVDLWILTHAHADHYGALEIISRTPALRERLTVSRLCACAAIPVSFPETDQAKIAEIPARLACEWLTPHAGDVLTVDGLEIRILYTWENDPKLADAKSFNRLSLIFTVTGAAHRAMFVGDSTPTGPTVVRDGTDPALLKSDFLQLAHHGLDGGNIGFYRLVDPTTVLIPCSLGGAKFIKAPETGCNYFNRYIQERALSVVCACMGNTEMEF